MLGMDIVVSIAGSLTRAAQPLLLRAAVALLFAPPARIFRRHPELCSV
jgi:hypothetical protein